MFVLVIYNHMLNEFNADGYLKILINLGANNYFVPLL